MRLGWAACLGMASCVAWGCSSSCNSPTAQQNATAATPAAFNADGAPTVVFSVPDMMCEDSCVPEVRKTLAAQPGVKDVKVELATKTAMVAVDKETFDANAAIAALVDLQFIHTKLVAGAGETAHN